MEETPNLDKKIDNSNTQTVNIPKKEYKLIKDNITYIIHIELEEKDSNSIIIIKASLIINHMFYLYEDIIDLNHLIKIFGDVENIEQGYQKLINLFDLNKAKIKDVMIDKFVMLNLVINNTLNYEIKLMKTNKEENIIINNICFYMKYKRGKKIKELIEKYSNLEKEYIQMKNDLTKENTALKLQVNNLNRNIWCNRINNINYQFNTNSNQNVPKIDEKDDENHITIEGFYSVWCMLKLNPINYIENGKKVTLNLVGIGMSNQRIILINLSTMKVHQTLEASNTVYSLCQFSNNSKYLFCSVSSGFIIVYKLKENNTYEEIQRIQKPEDLRRGEINKVITLSNGDLASVDRKSVTIWKQKKDDKNNLIDEFSFFKEILTDYDTCQLIEVNPNVFACAMYRPKIIKIFNNNGIDYPLLGTINNVESHGNNSNGMAKINEKIFCSGGRNTYIYIICVEPVEILQKIKLIEEFTYTKIIFLHVSIDGYLFTCYDKDIIQYKIIKDENNNFIELNKMNIISNKENVCNSIITTDNGKIFYQDKKDKNRFFLTSYKTS